MLETIYKDYKVVDVALRNYDLQEELLDLIVAIYGVAGREFNPDSFHQMVKHLKDSCDYSVMNMNSACVFAALLLIRYDYPLSKVAKLRQVINQVRTAGYRSRVSNYMAFILLDEENVDDILGKGSDIYKGMQEEHGMITGEDDFIATIFLAYLPFTSDKIIEIVESAYHKLSKVGFKKGNTLQNLSHLVTLLISDSPDAFIGHIGEVQKLCGQCKIKLNGSQYVLFGLTAFLVVDYPSYMNLLLSMIDYHKEALGVKRLRTLQTDILFISALEAYFKDVGMTYDDLAEIQKHGITVA